MATSTPSTSTPSLPEDQLLELLIQLQKTTPEQAKAILNAQPQIGYALVPLMAKVGVMNLEVVQRTLASYASQNQTSTSTLTPQSVPTPVPPAVLAIPSHLSQAQSQPPYGHQPTPPPVNPAIPPAATYAGAPPAVSGNGYPGYPQTQNGGYAAQGQYGQQYGQQYGASGQQQQQQQQQQQSWNSQQQQQQTSTSGAQGGTGMLGNLANIPEDQREMIMRVISMTSEQIRNLPPQERTITMQLRATLGLPAE